MKTISAKLRSNRGSSMVMALLLMLVAVMVSQTILAAASTAARNVQVGDRGQQAYLTVSSAAKTCRSAVAELDGTFQKSVKNIYSSMADYLAGRAPVRTEETEEKPADTLPFSKEVGEALAYAEEFDTDYERSYRIEAEGYDPVYMVLTIKKDEGAASDRYDLTASFSNADPDGQFPVHPYRIAITAQVTRETKEDSAREGQDYRVMRTTTWHFTKPVLQRNEEAANG